MESDRGSMRGSGIGATNKPGRPSKRTHACDCSCLLFADIVAKIFLGERTKILTAADAFYARRRERTISFIQNRSQISVLALESDAAAEKSKYLLSRDFPGRSILQQYRPFSDVTVPVRDVRYRGDCVAKSQKDTRLIFRERTK
jgi:hypothetical protein